MVNAKYYITNKNDMFVFFQMIEQIEPESVLDMGMFLKRIGAISRNVLDSSIDENIRLDAVDIEDSVKLAVYDTVYTNIVKLQNLDLIQKTDLVMMMDAAGIMSMKELENVILWSEKNAKYIVTDAETYKEVCKYTINFQTRDITVDDDVYYLLLTPYI